MAHESMQALRDEQLVLELLARLDPPEFATPQPNRLEFLNRAVAPAIAARELPWPSFRRLAIAFAAVFCAATLLTVLMYKYSPMLSQPAWAAVDGYMLEYQRVFRLVSPNSDGKDSDLKMMSQIAETLSEKYGDLDEASKGRPVLTFHSSQTKDLGYWRHRTYRFVALSDDAGLLAELDARMREFKAISGPKKIYQRFYYCDSYSDQPTGSQLYFQEGRKIIVDGKEFRIPQDVNPGLLHRFRADFESLDQDKVSIRAYWIPGELNYSPRLPNPMGVGQLSLVELNAAGNMVVTTLRDELDIEIPDELYNNLSQHVSYEEELGLDSDAVTRYASDAEARSAGCRPTITVDLPRTDYASGCDPISLIQAEVERKAELYQITQSHPSKHEFYFLISPESDWPQVIVNKLSDERIRANNELIMAASIASNRFVREHKSMFSFQHIDPASVDCLEMPGGHLLVISGMIYTDSEDLARGYQEALIGALGIDKPMTRVIPAQDVRLQNVTDASKDTTARLGSGQVWPTASGLSPYEGPSTCNLLWKYDAGSHIHDLVIADDGTVYACLINRLMAISPSGTLKWDYWINNAVYLQPRIGDDGTIYLTSSDHKARALTPDGQLKWEFVTNLRYNTAPVLAQDGAICFGSGLGIFYALDQNGVLKWKFPIYEVADKPTPKDTNRSYAFSSTLIFDPTIDANGRIYFCAADVDPGDLVVAEGEFGEIMRHLTSLPHALFVLDSDGILQNKIPLLSPCLAAPVIGQDGTIYVSCNDGSLIALTAEGTPRWCYNFSSPVMRGPSNCPDGSVVVSNLRNIYCIYPDGAYKWSYSIGKSSYSIGPVRDRPAVGADGTVYIGSEDCTFFALNTNGQLIWSYETEGKIGCTPAIDKFGVVYVGDSKGNIYAFGNRAPSPFSTVNGNSDKPRESK